MKRKELKYIKIKNIEICIDMFLDIRNWHIPFSVSFVFDEWKESNVFLICFSFLCFEMQINGWRKRRKERELENE